MTNATTLPLTVKVVRECSIKTLTVQRKFLDEKLREVVQAHNADVERHNTSRWTKLFNRPLMEPEDVEPTIESWKKQWLANKIDSDHPAREWLLRTRTTWWKRLKQFEQLPVADDEKVMQVSAEDLDLFDYNHWMKEQTSAS